MGTISIGLFFSRVLVVIGFLTLILGTIGGFVVTFEDVVYGLTAIVTSLMMSSLLIVVGSYVDVRLTRIVVEMASQSLRQQDPSLTEVDARVLAESDDELAVERFQERGD